MSASDAKQKKARRQHRKFTRELKDGAVKLVLDEGKGIPEVARDLDLTESALRTWGRALVASALPPLGGALDPPAHVDVVRSGPSSRGTQQELAPVGRERRGESVPIPGAELQQPSVLVPLGAHPSILRSGFERAERCGRTSNLRIR